MNVFTIFYELSTGRIIKYGDIQANLLDENTPPGASPLFGESWCDPTTQYISDGALVLRPEMPLTGIPTVLDIGESMTISGVPTGTTCFYIDGVQTIDDGDIEWASTEPGNYRFTLMKFPYQEVFFNVQVADI